MFVFVFVDVVDNEGDPPPKFSRVRPLLRFWGRGVRS